jgi:hypothetical protein
LVRARKTWPDRGGRHGALVEFGEYIVNWSTEIVFEHSAHLLKRHRRRLIAQNGQLALELGTRVCRHETQIDHRKHLAQLHRRALHTTKYRDDLISHVERALLQHAGAGLFGTTHGARSGAGLTSGLSCREAPERARTSEPGRRDFTRHSGAPLNLYEH